MGVYVDDVRHRYGRMIMCHMWADTPDELFAMADKIGLARKWLQQPPKASWVHFDVCLEMKAKAIAAGATLTDKYGPLEHLAKRNGNTKFLKVINDRRDANKNGKHKIRKPKKTVRKPFNGKRRGTPNHDLSEKQGQ